MEAKIINVEELSIKDMIKGNFLVHRFLSIFYSFMFVFFTWYTIVNWSLLIVNMQAMIMGIALLLLSAWVGFLWPIIRSILWYIKLNRKYHSNTQILNISFYDLYLKIESEELEGNYKLEYKDIYKIVETKKELLFTFGRNNFLFVKKSCFKKNTDLDKVKAYLRRQNLIR